MRPARMMMRGRLMPADIGPAKGPQPDI
jgi:hypothetical protein